MRVAARMSEGIWAIEPTALTAYLSRLASGELNRLEGAGGAVVQRIGDVAVVTVDGVLVPDAIWTGEVGSLSLARDLRRLADQGGVEVVVLRINSPGGAAKGMSELAAAAGDLARERPLLAQIDGVCCSAAYMLASQAGAIFAGPRDDIGGIGVRMLIHDFSEMFRKAGVEPVSVTTGPLKDMGVEGVGVTEAHRAAMQHRVGVLFSDFKAAVRHGRSMSEQNFASVATGGVWFGEQAAALGLVDGVQSFDETLRSVGVVA